MMFYLIFTILFAISAVHGRDTDAEFRRLPKLFHLDDFEQCLERRDGLYCMGVFEIYSDVENNPLYDFIQEKSLDIRLYNRTLLHRGYCLPTRCPSDEQNVTARFERCVDASVRSHSLRTRLQTLHYCRARGQPPQQDTSDLPHRVFLYVALVLLFMNVFGTVYDLFIGQRGKKNRLLRMFSLRINWIRLTALQDVSEPGMRGLQALYGLKTLLLLGALFAHESMVVGSAWLHNPRTFEKLLVPMGAFLGALTTFTQHFVLMSHFLTTYNLLLTGKKTKLGLNIIPFLLLKRVVRLIPVFVFVNAFSATWFSSMGDGPLWPLIVGTESKICREKFWIQSAFLQNFFEPNRICNVQTWIIAVDLQLYIPSLAVVILLMKRRQWALPILGACLAGATALTWYVAYTRHYIPFLYYMTPENFRTMFGNEKSFYNLFLQPLNCIMAMFLGIILGFMYFNHQEKEAKALSKSEEKVKRKPTVFLILSHNALWVAVFLWSSLCIRFLNITDPAFTAFLIAVERLVYSCCGVAFIYTSAFMKSPLTAIFGWRGLRVISRVSMSISMIHWSVNTALVASRHLLQDASLAMLIVDTIGISVISFFLAILLTLMVEYPTTKLAEKIISTTFRAQ